MANTIPLTDIVEVNVNVSPVAVVRDEFNIGLILGESAVIPYATRAKRYANLAAVGLDFGDTDAEYLGAVSYFGQSPTPPALWIGRYRKTGIAEVQSLVIGAKCSHAESVQVFLDGTTFSVALTTNDDTALKVATAIRGATFTGWTTGGTSATVTFTKNATGVCSSPFGYREGTSGASGTLTQQTVGEADETILDAINACRSVSTEWYGLALAKDIIASEMLDIQAVLDIADGVEAIVPSAVFFNLIDETYQLVADLENLKDAGYVKTISMVDNDLGHIALMGKALGLNYEGSPAFNLAYKSLVGVTPQTDAAKLATVLDNNGNIYVNQGVSYDLLRQGQMASGAYYDEVLYLDMLVNDIQIAIMTALTGSPKVPQTEAGMTQLIAAISRACDSYVTKGFIAEGVWNGTAVLNLATGDTLSKGYMIQSLPVAAQSANDRAARKATTMYVCIKLAGAIEHVVINVNVDR